MSDPSRFHSHGIAPLPTLGALFGRDAKLVDRHADPLRAATGVGYSAVEHATHFYETGSPVHVMGFMGFQIERRDFTSDASDLTSSSDKPSPEEWEQVKLRAIELMAVRTLDNPQAHLSYVRKQLGALKAGNVVEE